MEVKRLNKIEQQLEQGKEQLASVVTPEELENRLKKALDKTPTKRRKSRIWIMAAALAFLTLFVGYHYNAVAYYGKKLIGFDEVMTGTLQDLNDQGMGQVIDQSTDLAEGNRLYVDGIMADENQLILYYTIKNSDGVNGQNLPYSLSLSGFLTNSQAVAGTASLDDTQTELKGIQTFEPVSAFSKSLTLHFFYNLASGGQIERSITFPYNPNEAFHTRMKQSLKKTIKVDKGKVKFTSIIATPTMTTIKGTLKVENFDRVPHALSGIELKANSQLLEQLGSGSTSSLKGTEFELHYDPLPDQLDSLQLIMKEFVGYKILNEKVSLTNIGEGPIEFGGEKLYIKHIDVKNCIEVTIATTEDVMLDGVSIGNGEEVTPLETTVNQKESKQANGEILKERTLVFETRTQPDYIIIEGLHYMKEYKEKIDIPIKK